MDFLTSLEVSGSGLYAQRKRMDIIASNLANIETTRTKGGGPYRRKMVLMSTKPSENFDRVLNAQVEGVQIDGVVEEVLFRWSIIQATPMRMRMEISLSRISI